MTMMQLFFGFSGRISRKLFFFSYALLVVLSLLLTYLLLPVFDYNFATYWEDETYRAWQLDALVAGLFFWPDLALNYKRFHDLGWSGKPYGFFSLTALIFMFLTSLRVFSDLPFDNIYFGFTISLLAIVFLAVLYITFFKKGQAGANHYGPNPLDQKETSL